MENYVSAQLLLLGQAALLGMLGGVVYDLLRPLRRGRLIHLTDALFTGGGLVLMVWFLTAVSRGEARLFLLLGACGGAGLYFLLLAPLLRPLWDFWAAAAAAFGRLLALPLHFGVKLAKKIGNSLKKHFLFWKKYATMKQYRWEYPPSARRRKGDRYGTEEKHKKTPERSAGRAGAALHHLRRAAHDGAGGAGAGRTPPRAGSRGTDAPALRWQCAPAAPAAITL